MEPHKEKRSYQRFENQSPMNLHRMDCQDQCYYAEMNDYSQGGLSMITNEKLVIGQLVYLEMKNYNKSAIGPEKYKSYSGSVKWTDFSSLDDEEDKGPYKYGIECFESVQSSLH